MNLEDFCSRIDTVGYVRKFHDAYEPDWVKRTGVVDVEFPNGLLIPVATDAIHALNILRNYNRPASIDEIGNALNCDTFYQFFYVQQYLEVFAYFGIVKEVTNSEIKYSVLEQELAKCQVSNLLAAPEEDEKRFIALNIFHGMVYSLGEKNPKPKGNPKLLRKIYPNV